MGLFGDSFRKQEGLYTRWSENGQKEYEGNYKNGKSNGLWTYWDEKGKTHKFNFEAGY